MRDIGSAKRQNGGTRKSIAVKTASDKGGKSPSVSRQDVSSQAKRHEKAGGVGRSPTASIVAMLDLVPGGVFLWDTEGRVADLNKAGCALLGLERRQILRQVFSSFLAAADRTKFARFLKRTIAAEDAAACEVRLDSSEKPRWIRLEGAPRRIARRRSVHCLVVAMDVTAGKLAETRFKSLASFPMLNPVPIIEADLAGRLHFLNPAANRLFPDLMDRGAAHPWLADWSKVAEEIRRKRLPEFVRELSVGSRRYRQTMYFVKKTRRIRVYGQDITELKRTRGQVYELSQRLSYHVDHSPLAVIEWGPDMRLIRWSGEAERIFGWRAEEVLGKRMHDFRWIYDGDLSHVGEVETKLNAGNPFGRFSANRNYRKDGSVVHCEWYNSSLLDEAGRLRSILSLVLDVSQRKQAEEDLRNARDDLELRVEQRTAELAETVERLHEEMQERIRAERALQQEHDTLRRLLQATDRQRQNISLGIHDGLAQPLTSATMHLQAADGLKGLDPAAAAEAHSAGLAMLRASIDEARRLISDVRPPILDDEGIEAALAHLVCEFRGPGAPQIEFSVDARFGRLPPAIENAVYRIAQEGLSNACKHSRSQRVRIELVQPDEALLRIEIQDWGVGFDPQAAGEECFGLDEIRQRAKMLGGAASIRSAPGKGTQIIANIPLMAEI